MKGFDKRINFALVFGMNPLSVYLFSEVGGNRWLDDVVRPFTEGTLNWSGSGIVLLTTAIVVLWINWYAVNWLSRHHIYIRI